MGLERFKVPLTGIPFTAYCWGKRGGGGLFVFSWVLFGFCSIFSLQKTAVVEGPCFCETPADRVMIFLAAEKGF